MAEEAWNFMYGSVGTWLYRSKVVQSLSYCNKDSTDTLAQTC